MKRGRLAAALLATLLALMLGSRAARAADARPVVVGELEGERAEAARNALLLGLAGHDEIRLVSLAHAKQTADRMGAGLRDVDGVRQVASALRLAAYVDGSIESGKHWTAVVRVRSGASGEVTESVRFTASSGDALLEKLRQTAWKQLGPALADAEAASASGHRVVVAPFSGPKSATVRRYVVRALGKGKGISVVSDAKVRGSGIELGDESSADDYAGVAAATGASALIDGTVKTRGKQVSVELRVRNGADGSVVDSVTLESGWMPGLRNTINKKLVGDLRDPLSKTAPAPAPDEELPEGASASEASAAEHDADEIAEPEEHDEPAAPDARPSALEIGAGIRGFSRDFRYSDDLFDALRSYELGVAPAAFAQLRWYPVAHFDRGPLSNVGLTGGYEQGFALESKTTDGEKLDTRTREWWAGLRYRIPFGAHEIGVVGTYGKHGFEVDDDPANPLVPDVEYTYLRLGVDGRVRVSRVVLGAHVGYRYLLDTGELGQDIWFPNVSGGALDAGLLAGYEILDGLDLLAGFDFRRYFFSMSSEPGDARVAGGALDEYLSGWLGLGFRLPAADE